MELSIEELVDEIGDDKTVKFTSLLNRIFNQNKNGKNGEDLTSSSDDGTLQEIPDVIPLLPLRGVVVYPKTWDSIDDWTTEINEAY